MNNEQFVELSNQIYDLNESIHSLMFLIAELHGRKDLHIRGDNSFYFKEEGTK